MIKKTLISLLFCYSSLWSLCSVFFTPRDDLKSLLIECIKNERKSIDCAMYMFTEKSIADAMLDAHLRGVKVRIILDPISMGEKYGKGLFLQKNGVPVSIFDPSWKRFFSQPIMHHKFIIFGYNQQHQRSLVWTGSYNCTASASRLHEENVILLDDMNAISEYQKCFKMMLTRFDGIRTFEEETKDE